MSRSDASSLLSSPSSLRAVLHVDMDAFFASVEQRDRPELRGRPTLVAGRPPRGVVQAASYEARAYGCRSAMPTAAALRLCPDAQIIKGNFAKYRVASDAAFAVFRDYTDLVQPLSIDEAFLDVTGSRRLFGDPVHIAREIRRRVFEATGGLTCSVGVAPNKFLAKLASALEKPDGLTVLRAEEVEARLAPLPVGKLWGVGPAAERRLARFGVKTIADLREMPDAFFANKTTGVGVDIRRLAFGLDDRPVVPERSAKSIGSEQTFGEDIGDAAELRRVLLGQTEHVARRLRQTHRLARAVSLKFRHGESYSRFVTFGRRATLRQATDATQSIWATVQTLFDDWASADLRPLRLIGMSLSELSDPPQTPQMELFADEQTGRARRVDAALDSICARLGPRAVRRGV